ncbi:3-dehydroquinate synthase [Desulfomarina profundi]|uniref:3-dehydroquinate synthase n=1 Tax=Desulfomarina profundi TaxID=2772557 RepID=A0A8D5JDE7_9BACT|nr:3-dehydroquinate synthase [Desulfomarina profundi]BCL60993.1 3-dehydroquinate synthase [Desulfomarina profundi]
MNELVVGLDERSYPIYFQRNILEIIGIDLQKRNFGKKLAVISDEKVASLYGARLMESLNNAGLQAVLLTFPEGENNKTLETIGTLASAMAREGFDRHDAVIAFGGGVSGDIAGFLASAYMRGIPFVQIPTTLLAQVDSSVGGKTGVDIPEGKNLLGAFYQPRAVYIDIGFLKTLPEDELLGGMAEVIKYGVIRDREFFGFLERNRQALLQLDTELLTETVFRCCKIKAEVVAEDEREGDIRRILNYGHTIGHAVESASDFRLIHGLAVSVGMAAAAEISHGMGQLAGEERDRVIKILTDYNMPTRVPVNLDRKRIRKYLLTDKKVVDGSVFFVLPQSIGEVFITDQIEETLVDEVIGG